MSMFKGLHYMDGLFDMGFFFNSMFYISIDIVILFLLKWGIRGGGVGGFILVGTLFALNCVHKWHTICVRFVKAKEKTMRICVLYTCALLYRIEWNWNCVEITISSFSRQQIVECVSVFIQIYEF